MPCQSWTNLGGPGHAEQNGLRCVAPIRGAGPLLQRAGLRLFSIIFVVFCCNHVLSFAGMILSNVSRKMIKHLFVTIFV